MSGFTKGPYRASTMKMDHGDWSDLNDRALHIVQRGHDVVAVVWDGDDRGDVERKSNSSLFAAAPDMYEALKQAEKWLELWASAEPYLTTIRAALAKADGK